MNDLKLTRATFNQNKYWTKPLVYVSNTPTADSVELFDQNGYDLTDLEQKYAKSNMGNDKGHRYRKALKEEWFTQPEKTTGAVLNHACLFERKSYNGAALEQLQKWAKTNNLLYKLISMRSKWGMDFSMDYVDESGNAFEVFHWEYDGFSFDEINDKKSYIEEKFLSIDWDEAGKEMLQRKNEWHHLGFFEQSDWKCKFFGIEKERFKMVIWS